MNGNEKEDISLKNYDKHVKESGGDYSVKKNKNTDLFARILSIIAAVFLWFYVVNNTNTTVERTFELVPIVLENEVEMKTEYDLVVQSMNADTVNITVMGDKDTVKRMTKEDIKVYVDLSSVNTSGNKTLDLVISVPSGITISDQSFSKVTLSIDKPAQKKFLLNDSNIRLSSYSLENGYIVNSISLNMGSITIAGPALEVNKVQSVRIVTVPVGKLTNTISVSGSVELLDANGNVINSSSITIEENAVPIIHVDVYKEKTVPIKVVSQNGFLSESQISLSPSSVKICGEPSAVDKINEILVAEINEKELTGDLSDEILLAIPEGIVRITDENGLPVDKVGVTVDVGEIRKINVSNIVVLGNDGAEADIESIELSVRSDNAPELLYRIEANDIVVYVNASGHEIGEESKQLDATVVFSDEFTGKVYEIGTYKVPVCLKKTNETPVETVQPEPEPEQLFTEQQNGL